MKKVEMMKGASNTSLVHMEMYGPYTELVATGSQDIYVNQDINKNTWQEHYDSIFNILKDGIETKLVQTSFVHLYFDDENHTVVDLSIIDYWLTLIPWYLLVSTDTKILPKHLFFADEFKKNSISSYINKFFIEPNRKKFTTRQLNNIIDDMMHLYQGIDGFSMYLANTINLEDSIKLMKANPEFYDILHKDMSDVPMEDMKSVGMQYAGRSIDIIKKESKKVLGYDHCFADSFRASESINPKQYKEAFINIGTKPDGQGGIFSKPINKSFINGGLQDPVDYFIESSTGRTAQILQKLNVGNSGHFARLLGLNNTESYLHKNPDYVCDSKRMLKVTVSSLKFLFKLNNRYYRLNPRGIEKVIKFEEDQDLVGKTIYLRSPMTCASHARGEGICYRCYGDLAYTENINIGRIASELLTAVLTQILLSAKHLIEAVVRAIKWCKAFGDFFVIDGNSIAFSDALDPKDWNVLIDPELIEMESDIDIGYGDDDEDSDPDNIFGNQFNEYITEFKMQNINTGEEIVISSETGDSLYISTELNNIIRKKAEPMEGYISISGDDLKDVPLFFIHIQNNDLTKIFDDIKYRLNNAAGIKGLDIDTWMQTVVETVIASDLNISSVHLEVIMSNQIRSVDNPLFKPEWQYPNEPYHIVTLNTALTDNPSAIVSLSYQKVAKALYNPLTFKKRGASFLDLFFMEAPHIYVNNAPEENTVLKDENGLRIPIVYETVPNSDDSVDVPEDIDEE